MTPREFQTISRRAQTQADQISDEAFAAFEAKLQREMQESFDRGEGRDEWQKRAGFLANYQRGLAETLQRTWTHRAYHAGMEEIVQEHPEVADEFPYRLYQSSRDNRTRPTHRELDGKVAHVGSPLHKRMEEQLQEWGCRCTSVPMTRDDAVQRGIDDNTGWRDEATRTVPAIDTVATLADGQQVAFRVDPGATPNDVQITVDAQRLDAAWQSAPEYVAPEKEGKPGSRDVVTKAVESGATIDTPRVTVREDGDIQFIDGRHRTAVLRDKGADQIVVSVPIDKADALAAKTGANVVIPPPTKPTAAAVEQMVAAAPEFEAAIRAKAAANWRPGNIYALLATENKLTPEQDADLLAAADAWEG